MQLVLLSILGVLALGIVFYILYINGYMIINAKRAVMFMGSMRGKNNSCKAIFSSCDGYIKRVIRFRKSQIYNAIFDCEMTDGTMTVELLDSTRQSILTLDDTRKSGQVFLNKNERYYLVFQFHSASGQYRLKWNSVE